MTPRQQPNGPPLTSPCASGGRVDSGEAAEEGGWSAGASVGGGETSSLCASVSAVVSGSGKSCISSGIRLKRSKLAVARVTKARQDIANVVQALVERRDIDVDVGMSLRQLE